MKSSVSQILFLTILFHILSVCKGKTNSGFMNEAVFSRFDMRNCIGCNELIFNFNIELKPSTGEFHLTDNFSPDVNFNEEPNSRFMFTRTGTSATGAPETGR